MKAPRRVIPYSPPDRFAALSFVILVLLSAYEFGAYGLVAGVSGLVSSLGFFVAAYLLQSRPTLTATHEQHSKAIAELEQIRVRIASIGEFLLTEQDRVKQARDALAALEQEQSRLKPVVESSRSTVEAILSAHAANTRLLAWKERIIGFSLGIFASLVASFLYEWAKQL